MAKVTVNLKSSDSYYAEIISGEHVFHSDEPLSSGGTDKAADPVKLALGALGACTVMTIKMYLDQKGWAFSNLSVVIDSRSEVVENVAVLPDEERPFVFDRRIRRISKKIYISGISDKQQLDRILNISKKCPVNKMFKQGSFITDEIIAE